MGVDVGTKADIYALLARHAESGGAVIIVSSDFEEIAIICNRALIFDRGEITAELLRDQLSVTNLISYVGGAVPPPSPVDSVEPRSLNNV
jgi:ribose transport system ATP-binding protein